MSALRLDGADFVGFEYLELPPEEARTSMLLDAYPSFGWVPDERPREDGKIVLKRERKLVGRVELTRLQRHFDACVNEIEALERSRTAGAAIRAILVGLIGTGFMAGATVASVIEPPNVLLAIALFLPGLIGWILPLFLYREMVFRRTKVVEELVEQKYDEIYDICKKGSELLH